MDTRLRSYSRHWITKGIAFLLFIVCMTAAVWQLQYILIKGMNTESLVVKEYKVSKDFISYISKPIYEVMDGYDTRSIDFNYHYYDGAKYFKRGIDRNSKLEDRYNIYYSDIIDGYVFVSIPRDTIEAREENWKATREELSEIIYKIVYLMIFSFLLLSYMIAVTGRVHNNEQVHLKRYDKVYLELKLLVFFLSTGGLLYIIYSLIVKTSPLTTLKEEYPIAYFTDYLVNNTGTIFNISAIAAILTALTTFSLLSLIRTYKSRSVLSHSLIYKLLKVGKRMFYGLCKILEESRMFHDDQPIQVLFYRQQLFVIASVVLTLFIMLFALILSPFLIIIAIILESMLIYWYVKGNKQLYQEITTGYNDRVAQQMKSERMKVALITNVSHDLKTPITSFISYLDLLSKEEGLSNTSVDYVKVLQDKSNRLKNTVNDLFDLAKSTSGDMALTIEELDLKKLIEQTLADMEDRIEASELVFKTSLPDQPVHIVADGTKLYRVFQNVFDNAIKYSMKGTRVFIDLTLVDDKAVTTIKNTADYEINFTSEEVLQRFTRGDNSRSTEGSGLGLSIAESFTQINGGAFKVEIDGDLFKVIIYFDLCKALGDQEEEGNKDILLETIDE